MGQGVPEPYCLKITQNFAFDFFNCGTSTILCPLKIDLSRNTASPQASGFRKPAKVDHFWHF